jgi:16S rRNA (cytosine1402-N4)-methyltransferase
MGERGHVPVLADELLELLDPQPGQTAIDCTFGDGGHARLLAERLGPTGMLIAIDRDPLAEERFAALAADVGCSVRFIRAGYVEALDLLAREGVRADAAYFDLGMSSMQVDARERGFSYSYEAPLDMRMDPLQELSAREIVAEWDERRLARTLRDFGEERHAGAIARAIVRRRAHAPIETTLELVEAINSALPAPARFAGGHPAKRSFQALRIAVNDELDQLERALPLAWGLLRDGGVIAGISFHSLEDRRVKRFLAARAQGCVCPPDLPVCACGREPEAALLTRRSIVPSAQEVQRNPRASSARLRAARKLGQARAEENAADGRDEDGHEDDEQAFSAGEAGER